MVHCVHLERSCPSVTYNVVTATQSVSETVTTLFVTDGQLSSGCGFYVHVTLRISQHRRDIGEKLRLQHAVR